MELMFCKRLHKNENTPTNFVYDIFPHLITTLKPANNTKPLKRFGVLHKLLKLAGIADRCLMTEKQHGRRQRMRSVNRRNR